MLESSVYQIPEERVSVYCAAAFNENKQVVLPEGIRITKFVKRAKKIEWEHIVPAENFGRTFTQWREGDSDCVNRSGKAFKGRRCAEKTNQKYRLMQADMHNLYPAIGAVNAARSNFNFAMLGDEKSSFGACEMKIVKNKVEPPIQARGVIARSYLYMESNYPEFTMSKQQAQLMSTWHKQFPVTSWECLRGARIAKLQGNANNILAASCRAAGY